MEWLRVIWDFIISYLALLAEPFRQSALFSSEHAYFGLLLIVLLAVILLSIQWRKPKHIPPDTVSSQKGRSASLGIVGPFLGPRGPGKIRIVIGLLKEAGSIQCSLLLGQTVVDSKTVEPGFGVFKSFAFDFEGLTEGKKYNYRFERSKGGDVDLEGIGVEDCYFIAPGNFSEDDSFILMSCHNPYEIDKNTKNPWVMWDRLLGKIESDNSIKLLVLGGDQVYNDDVEGEFMSELREDEAARKHDPNLDQKLRERFARQYQVFWENPSYRKVLARIPSIAIWDDHDITDGWGGRPESYKKKSAEFRPEWARYFKIAQEAFDAYQAVRNPQPLVGVPENVRTFCSDFGCNRIYMMDFRTEKCSKESRLWGPDHKKVFLNSIARVPDSIKRVFFLSPVVPLRTDFDIDKKLTGWANMLFKFWRWKEQNPWLASKLWLFPAWLGWFWLVFTWFNHPMIAAAIFVLAAVTSVLFLVLTAFQNIPELPRLTDDLEDSLGAECNRETLKEILNALFGLKANGGKEVVVLSGDIHLCGMTEIIEGEGDAAHSIAQVVSSPISYKPTPPAVEGFTTSTEEIDVGVSGPVRHYARNIFYTSRRNFAQIFPGRLGDAAQRPFVFYLEGHERPLKVPHCF